jgi:two-component system sensor histidine kinase MtrB
MTESAAATSGLTLRSPVRLRRRLTIVCILLAGLSAGFLAVTSYFIIRETRSRAFDDQAQRKVELVSVLLPGELEGSELERALEDYGQRGDFDAIAVTRDGVVSSTPNLGLRSVPASLREDPSDGQVHARASIEGQSTLVIRRPGAGGEGEIYFFFSREDLEASITQFRNVLMVAWLITVALGAVGGALVARRVLRPVRDAADSAQALAVELLGAKVRPGVDDEFETWVRSYHELADALEAKIAELSSAAERERRFTSDVAHELRTPLTALTSAATVLEARVDEIPPDMRRAAELLVGDVRRLSNLVVELLELARLDAGGNQVLLEPVLVEPALAAIVQPWRADATVRCRVEPELRVLTDRARFRRVIGNLVENAVRHGAGRRGPAVEIDARRDGDRVAIAIRDHGPGVAADDAQRIFERFSKVHVGRSHPGSGLGLSIAREHARIMGATVQLTNPGARGACFTVTLPGAADPMLTPEPVDGHEGMPASSLPAQ